MKKVSWGNIPTLELEVDWEYSPENPLGKRSWVRISNIILHRFLGVENIKVKIVSSTLSKIGELIDISSHGLAVLVDKSIQVGTPVKVGLFLGKHKIISKGKVKNNSICENSFRVGIEFVELKEEDVSYITELTASDAYRHKR